jgi:hypothetical protein
MCRFSSQILIKMNPKDIENPIAELDFRHQLQSENNQKTFAWKREGSFLDQIKDVWRCYVGDNKHYSASVKVDTINSCSISINGDTHKRIYGVDNAKKYVESELNK